MKDNYGTTVVRLPYFMFLAKDRQVSCNRCELGASTTRYASFFRPDSEFNYQYGNASGVKCTK